MRWLWLLIVCAINLFVLLLWLAVLAWLIGRVCTDRFAWSQWLWWIPTPATLIVAVMGFVLAFRAARTRQRRRRRVVLWGATVVSMAVYFLAIEHRFLHAASTPDAAALTIAHWNMTLDNRSNNELLVRKVQALGCDITALTNPSGEVRRLLNEEAAASSPEHPWFTYDTWPVYLRTRFPVLRIHVLTATDGICVTAVELDASKSVGRPIVLYLVDLPSNPRRPRMAMARAARELIDQADAPTPDVVVGDFNITRDSASIAMLFPGMTDAFDVAGHGYGASFPRRLPVYHIDHVLLDESAGWRAERYDLMDEGASRHRTQKAWLTLR